jgi:hypothetical protein
MNGLGHASNEVIITSIFLGLEGAFAYSAFLPSIMTIGTFVDSPEKVRMIRQGEVVGSIFLVALALTVSSAMKHPLPLFLALLSGGLAIIVYEFALRQSPAWEE